VIGLGRKKSKLFPLTTVIISILAVAILIYEGPITAENIFTPIMVACLLLGFAGFLLYGIVDISSMVLWLVVNKIQQKEKNELIEIENIIFGVVWICLIAMMIPFFQNFKGKMVLPCIFCILIPGVLSLLMYKKG
jgi:hypothetical protein